MPKKTVQPNSEERLTVRLGKVTGFLGLKGFLKIRPATNNAALFLDIEDVAFWLNGELKESGKVKDIRIGKHNLELLLEDHLSRTSVEHLLNAEVFTAKEQVINPPENEWWVSDLVGLKVYTTAGKFIGTICDAVGKQGDFLEIRKDGDQDGETILVPFVRQLVPVVDLESKRIEVVDLPGLFES